MNKYIYIRAVLKCTVVLMILLSAYRSPGQCAGCTITISGADASARSIGAADVMCITGTGSYTGALTLNGGTICNEGTFTPSSVTDVVSTVIHNYGTSTFGAGFIFSKTNFTNFLGGTMNFGWDPNIATGSLINNGTMNFTGGFGSLTYSNSASGPFINTGTLTANTFVDIAGGVGHINSGTMTIGTRFDFGYVAGSDFTNNGEIYVGTTCDISNEFYNNDTLRVSGAMVNHNAGDTLRNAGGLYVVGNYTLGDPMIVTGNITVDGAFTQQATKSLLLNGCLTVGGNFIQGATVINNSNLIIAGTFTPGTGLTFTNNQYISCNALTNNATLTGPVAGPCSRIDVTGFSRNNVTITGYIDINDLSDPGTMNILGPTIGPNVTFGTCAPASVNCPPTVLPVSLVSLEAHVSDRETELHWKTIEEFNNDHFVVQRSVDNGGFVDIARVEGNGNSRELKEFRYVDSQIGNGRSQYRLKQVDFDGTTEFSRVVSVQNEVPELESFPNPFEKSTRVSLANFDENLIIRVYNSAGQLMDALITTDQDYVDLGHDWDPGVYIVSVSAVTEVKKIKVVKGN